MYNSICFNDMTCTHLYDGMREALDREKNLSIYFMIYSLQCRDCPASGF